MRFKNDDCANSCPLKQPQPNKCHDTKMKRQIRWCKKWCLKMASSPRWIDIASRFVLFTGNPNPATTHRGDRLKVYRVFNCLERGIITIGCDSFSHLCWRPYYLPNSSSSLLSYPTFSYPSRIIIDRTFGSLSVKFHPSCIPFAFDWHRSLIANISFPKCDGRNVATNPHLIKSAKTGRLSRWILPF